MENAEHNINVINKPSLQTFIESFCTFCFTVTLITRKYGSYGQPNPADVRIYDSSVGIATGYGLDEQRGGSSSPGRVKKFSLLHIVQTGSGVHPTSYKMGTWVSFPGVKRQGREADHSPLTSAEVKKMWIYTSTPPYVFMA
jgi:hypothetical protein